MLGNGVRLVQPGLGPADGRNIRTHRLRCAQVKVLEFHPVQPWLAYADGSQAVVVWDWSSQQVGLPYVPTPIAPAPRCPPAASASARAAPQVVWEAALGAADDAPTQDALLQKLAERHPGYYGAAEPVRPPLAARAPGTPRGLCRAAPC
jgi:hypothetical protein